MVVDVAEWSTVDVAPVTVTVTVTTDAGAGGGADADALTVVGDALVVALESDVGDAEQAASTVHTSVNPGGRIFFTETMYSSGRREIIRLEIDQHHPKGRTSSLHVDPMVTPFLRIRRG